ncbi:MAG TPA: F0F1 ATP synthase subunit delta [Porticoccaceae bacterium]|nr:F0F1 ATP synthase subunit delta [Porticoccaceae bacterium]HCO59130.1 F0F1 ATP synthase subunit delta [Porticoccaceae bacterium]
MAELSTLARPYAKAAFEHAAASNTLASWSQALGLLDMLVADERIGVQLRSPSLARDQRAQLLIDISGEDLEAPVRNFLNALAENDRLLLLPAIFEQFQALKADHERLVEVQVTSAAPIDDSQRAKLAEALVKRLGREVNIEVSIDPGLIGGAIIRAGDTVIDGSLRGRLNKLSDALLS